MEPQPPAPQPPHLDLDAAEEKAPEQDPRKRGGRGLHETLFVVCVTVLLALGVQAAVAKPYSIPSESMVPTLEVGQRVIVDRVSYRFSEPRVGDIVVFQPPVGVDEQHGGHTCAAPPPPGQACAAAWDRQSSGVPYIKRIVGGPGDRIAIRDGHVIRNGEASAEPFAVGCVGAAECDLPEEIVVPEGHYFMMGDNRGHSLDSRAWGPVPKEWIVGKARLTYWPPKRIGLL